MMNGGIAAKQNHSGVVAYLGEGATFSIAEQIASFEKTAELGQATLTK
jgi:hypothetical protein